MASRPFIIALYIFILLMTTRSNAQDTNNDQHIKVSLRMIAHQVLLNSGDSTSRVLPIVREGSGRYRIPLESEFEFMPEELVATIDRIVKQTKLAKHYIVEVEKCKTSEMVYSFEMYETEQSDIIPCEGRNQPKSCYNLLFTLIKTGQGEPTSISNTETNYLIYLIVIMLIIVIAVTFFVMRKRNAKTTTDPNMISLGEYQYDRRNTTLVIEEQKIDLTSKESDLLFLLYNAANTTVEREVILNRVWGDEGDYVGRTLDVFISKLRKKLEFDSKVKIINIRGIGYKLVVDA